MAPTPGTFARAVVHQEDSRIGSQELGALCVDAEVKIGGMAPVLSQSLRKGRASSG